VTDHDIAPRLHGVHVPLITPFDADGRVALDALETLAREVLADGAAGLVALGTTGEAAALDPGERREVVAVLAGVCRELGAPLTVGPGAGTPGGPPPSWPGSRSPPGAARTPRW
jgi:4-hydroxy-tetrahydrodipicolinate synthase